MPTAKRINHPAGIGTAPEAAHKAGPEAVPEAAPEAAPGDTSSNAIPDQAAAPELQGGRMEKANPLETWANRPAMRTGKQGIRAGEPIRNDDDARQLGIRLADDFRLPVSIMAAAVFTASPSSNVIPAPIKDVSEKSITDFYQSVAAESSLHDGSEPVVEIEPVTGELTQVIASNGTTDRITEESDELFRSLFGAMAYDQILRQSTIERTLPATDMSLPAD